MEIRIYDMQDGVRTLGPGNRFALWVQGCRKRCEGCMTPKSRDLEGGRVVTVSEVAERILSSGREGMTVSGGEPFLQAKALTALIEEVRARADMGVIVYTGYTLKELRSFRDGDIDSLLARTDLLVDGPYVDDLNDGRNWRGSSNQRAIALSDRYRGQVEEYGAREAEVEFFYREDKMSMVGVPSREVLERFRRIAF